MSRVSEKPEWRLTLLAPCLLHPRSEYATDMSATVAARSIRSIGDIVLRVPNALGNALDKVLALAELDMDHVTAECLVVAQGTSPFA